MLRRILIYAPFWDFSSHEFIKPSDCYFRTIMVTCRTYISSTFDMLPGKMTILNRQVIFVGISTTSCMFHLSWCLKLLAHVTGWSRGGISSRSHLSDVRFSAFATFDWPLHIRHTHNFTDDHSIRVDQRQLSWSVRVCSQKRCHNHSGPAKG